MFQRRLMLTNTTNTRELGGYCGKEGRITKYKSFLRSDDVSQCNEGDIAKLKNYGVKTIIDLRGKSELIRKPNIFASCNDLKYFNIPLIPEEKFEVLTADITMKMDQVYVEIIKNHEAISKLFTVILENREGTILFHCTAGKDRTGVTALLLFMLAGAELTDIIADYQVTYLYIQPLIKKLTETYPDMPVHVMQCEPQWIVAAFNYILDTYGDVDSYFSSVGFSEAMVKSLKNIII